MPEDKVSVCNHAGMNGEVLGERRREGKMTDFRCRVCVLMSVLRARRLLRTAVSGIARFAMCNVIYLYIYICAKWYLCAQSSRHLE